MPIGPRLDRPSAIGDEGRPRAASLVVASLVVVVVVALGTVLLGLGAWVSSIAMAATLTGAGMALLERERVFELLVGHALVVGFGTVAAVIAIAAPLYVSRGFVVTGFTVTLFGLALTWTDAGDGDGFDRATRASSTAAGAAYIWFVGLLVLVGVVAFLWVVLRGLLAQSSPPVSALGFLFVLGCSAAAVGAALRRLPIRQLTPRSRRAIVDQRLAVARSWIRGTVVASFALLVLTAVVWAHGSLTLALLAFPPLGVAMAALSSPLLVVPVVVLGTVALLASLVATTVRQLAGQFDEARARRVAAGGAGLVLAFVGVSLVLLVLAQLPILVLVAPALLAALLLGPLAIVVAIAVGKAAISMGVLPDHEAGPALAASGLVLAAVGTGRGPPALVFALVAAALVVWEVATFGRGLTDELGHLPETRRLELFHAVLVVAAAAVVVLAALGVDFLRTAAFGDVGGTWALLLVSLGVLFLLVPVSRRIGST